MGFATGALAFVIADYPLNRKSAGNPTGLALLAGVRLDGIPENTAFWVSLTDAGSIASWSRCSPATSLKPSPARSGCGRRAAAPTPWWRCGRARHCSWLLRSSSGRLAFTGASPESLAIPLALAAGAVLAPVIDTLALEAVGDGGPLVAQASAAGFATGYILSL